MSNEIKLGWYQRRGNPLDRHEVVYATTSEVVIKTRSNSVFIWRADHLRNFYDYIGPELGEWVNAEDTLMVRELPIKARVRNRSCDPWIEARLVIVDGAKMYKYCVDNSLVSRSGIDCYGQCQIWRAIK
jgi:hypothetical protein